MRFPTSLPDVIREFASGTGQEKAAGTRIKSGMTVSSLSEPLAECKDLGDGAATIGQR
jgi:hypothetical protein